VEHRTVGERLAELSGIPYFYIQGRTKGGLDIGEHKGPAIVSRKSISEGHNLHDRWDTNLVLSCEPNGKSWEQMIGRTHRDGQTSDEVMVYMHMICIEQWYGLQRAISKATYAEQTSGQAQKLVYATKDVPDSGYIERHLIHDVLWNDTA